MIKICTVCGVESKALHLHMKKHAKETTTPGFDIKSTIEKAQESIKENYDNPPMPEALKDGHNIPLTEEALNNSAEPEEKVSNVNNCEYRLTMNFNGQVFDCFTNNLKISMLSFKPTQMLTEGYIKITKGTAVFERTLTLIKLKQLFADEQSLDIFLETFYSLYGRPSKM